MYRVNSSLTRSTTISPESPGTRARTTKRRSSFSIYSGAYNDLLLIIHSYPSENRSSSHTSAKSPNWTFPPTHPATQFPLFVPFRAIESAWPHSYELRVILRTARLSINVRALFHEETPTYPSTSRSVASFSAIGWHSSIGSEQTRSATGFSWVSGVRCYSCHCQRRLEHWNGKEGRRDKRAVPRARLLSFRCTRKRSGSVLYRPSFFALGQAASCFLSVVDECLRQGRGKTTSGIVSARNGGVDLLISSFTLLFRTAAVPASRNLVADSRLSKYIAY